MAIFSDTQNIEFHPREDESGNEKLFSILIPTWNNLEYLKLCIASIQKNSRFPHQIIVHVNEGIDGTLDWIKTQKLDFSSSKTNIGVCRAMNAAASLAKTDYFVYVNDDMYACPGWDVSLRDAVKEVGHKQFYISATPIEPTNSRVHLGTLVVDFGRNPSSFREAELLENYAKLERPDWCGASSPPCLVHREMWEAVNGYSEEFITGYGSDPDFSMKLWHQGVRYFKGIGNSRFYHFAKVSTKKLARGSGKKARCLLLKKWDVSQEVFYEFYLRMGEPWTGPQPALVRRSFRLFLKNSYWKMWAFFQRLF
jgi:GT2 family glycosyltransferase